MAGCQLIENEKFIHDRKFHVQSLRYQKPRQPLTTPLLALVLRELRSTHAKVNGTEEVKGENGDGNIDGNV